MMSGSFSPRVMSCWMAFSKLRVATTDMGSPFYRGAASLVGVCRLAPGSRDGVPLDIAACMVSAKESAPGHEWVIGRFVGAEDVAAAHGWRAQGSGPRRACEGFR